MSRNRGAQFRPDAFEKIQSYFSLVNPNLGEINVHNDTYENRLRVSAKLYSEGNEIQMPLNLLSDGTIKWLALVTAISTNLSYFAIEEPENYIHPKMQSEFASIVRDAFEFGKDNFALITTHSETLLNAVKPSEIVVVHMDDGKTVARRLFDPDLISSEINRTGFGLGYYYVTGAIDG